MNNTLDLPGLDVIPWSDMIEIPVYRSLIPRLPLNFQNDIIGYNHIQKDNLSEYECFGYLVQDNSMNKENIKSGSIAIIEATGNIQNKTLVLVHFKNYGTTIRRVYLTKSSITFYPESLDSSYKPCYCKHNDKNYYVFGKIISVINRV